MLQINVVLRWLLIQMMTSINKGSSHLVISIKYQYLIGIAILITTWVGSLIALLILNFDTMDTPIYQSNTGHHRHFKYNLLGLQHKLAI